MGLSDAISKAISEINVPSIGPSVTSEASNFLTGTAAGLGQAAIGGLALKAASGANAAASTLFNNLLGSTLSGPGVVSQSVAALDAGLLPGNDLAGVYARSDPLLSFCWYAQLPVINSGSTQQSSSNTPGSSIISTITNGLAGAATSLLKSTLGGSVATASAANLPWYFVEEAALPFRSFVQKSIFREGKERHYPDKYSVGNLRLAIYADTANVSMQYLQAWNNNILTPFSSKTSSSLAGGWGRPSDYKKSIYIYLLDAAKNALIIVEYQGCWPMTLADYSLDGASNRVVNHVDFSVDDVFVNQLALPGGIVNSILQNSVINPLTSAINGTVNSLTSKISSGLSSLL